VLRSPPTTAVEKRLEEKRKTPYSLDREIMLFIGKPMGRSILISNGY